MAELTVKYKFANEEGTVVNNLETGASGIHKGVWMWESYQAYVDAGGLTEAFKTARELWEETKREDEQAVRNTFDIDSEAPVTVGLYTFNGGQDSSGYIDGAIALAQALGETTVDITDIDNVARTLTFEEAQTAVVMISKAFRDAFFAKQAGLVEIAGRVFNE